MRPRECANLRKRVQGTVLRRACLRHACPCLSCLRHTCSRRECLHHTHNVLTGTHTDVSHIPISRVVMILPPPPPLPGATQVTYVFAVCPSGAGRAAAGALLPV